MKGRAWVGGLLAATAIAACKDAPATFRPLSEGDAAPAFSAPTLAGDSVSVASLRGHVVVLNVWATWCVPCRREMPLLDSLSREFANQGVRVVGVSIDADGASESIATFVEQYQIGFTIVHDAPGTIQSVYKMRGVPETFLLDRSGVIRKHWVGGVDGPDVNVRDAVRALL